MRRYTRRQLLLLGLAFVGLGAALAFSAMSRGPSRPPATPTPQVGPLAAFVACQGFVTKRLDIPASATFAPYNDRFQTHVSTAGLSGYRVASSVIVHGQRTRYTCEATPNRDGSWRLDQLTTD